jgi:hypothetical protein
MHSDRKRAESLAGALALALFGLFALSAAASAGDFYVSAGAPADSADGTVTRPYPSMTAALADHRVPGTTIHVLPGIYPEQVDIPASGTPGSYIYLLAEPLPGQPVVIEGADDYSISGMWTADAGPVWRDSSFAVAPWQVIVDGTRMQPDSLPPGMLPVGHWSYAAGNGLYVNLGGDSPGTHQTWVSVREYGISAIGRSWIAINGFTIQRSGVRGINLTSGVADAEVTQNSVSGAGGYGILAATGTRVHIASNLVSNNGDHGIALTHGSTTCVVEHNESFSNARPGQRAANGIYLDDASQNTIRWNNLHNNQDSGLQMDPGATGNLSLENCSWNNGDHGYDHLGATGNMHVGDVASGNFKDGFSFEGNAGGNSLEDAIAINNGLTTNEFDLWVDSLSSIGFQSNDNIFWNSTAQQPVKYGQTLYTSVATYAAASGQDSRTLQADPMFVNGPGGDFHLTEGSPAIDSGNSSVNGWSSVDADGLSCLDDPNVPNTGIGGPVVYADRGAFEFQVAVTAVASPGAPDSGLAEGVFPNPLRGSGALTFTTSRVGRLQAYLVDASGRVVRRLADQESAASGRHLLRVDTVGNEPLAAGVYFYRVNSTDGTKSGRFVVSR